MCYNIIMKLEKYNKELPYSYTLGAYPTFELIKNKPKQTICVLLHSKATHTPELEKLIDLCKKQNIKVEEDDKTINKLSPKENCFVLGVFYKYLTTQTKGKEICLYNPSDTGNLGTIMRTMVGFNYTNLSIIKPSADPFNPKTIRASMGAIFMLNIKEFDSLADYIKSNNNPKYYFMLNGTNLLGQFTTPKTNYSLVFGNEAHGLPNDCLNLGTSVKIEHSNKIDSLNLPISVAMAIYQFNQNN